jgi:hypothetical protein
LIQFKPSHIFFLNPINAELNPICHLLLLFVRRFNVYGSVHCKYIPLYMYIQQDVRLHTLFISGNCSTCFGWYFHSSSGAHTTVSTAYGICHTVTLICRYRGRVGTGLIVLWVAYATHSTLKPVPIDDDGWKYHPKHVEHFPDINKLCKVPSCWIYIGILLGAHPILHISRIRVNVSCLFYVYK